MPKLTIHEDSDIISQDGNVGRSGGDAYRSAYTETPDATDALPKELPPCLASGGHETSVWMFPGSYHMILDVSFGFITVSEVLHPHKRSYYRRRCTVKSFSRFHCLLRTG